MDKITRKNSFGQWFSPINLQLFEEQTNFKKRLTLIQSVFSQLSLRLNGMNPDLFQRLFLDLVSQIHAQTHDTKLVMPLKIIYTGSL